MIITARIATENCDALALGGYMTRVEIARAALERFANSRRITAYDVLSSFEGKVRFRELNAVLEALGKHLAPYYGDPWDEYAYDDPFCLVSNISDCNKATRAETKIAFNAAIADLEKQWRPGIIALDVVICKLDCLRKTLNARRQRLKWPGADYYPFDRWPDC